MSRNNIHIDPARIRVSAAEWASDIESIKRDAKRLVKALWPTVGVLSQMHDINKKTCRKCGIEKPLDHFSKEHRATGVRPPRKGYGVAARCRLCTSETRKPGLQAEREQRAEWLRLGLKRCGKCKGLRPFAEFHKRVASKDGLALKCKTCVNGDTENWRKQNPGSHAKWYQENKEHKAEYFKAWRDKNKETEPSRMAQWAKLNRDKVYANIARKRASKLQAIPTWANQSAIAAVYAEAARLRKETGERYEVDHIVPLQSKIVCGLHWEGNLQIILKFDNISKLNRRWPGMPSG